MNYIGTTLPYFAFENIVIEIGCHKNEHPTGKSPYTALICNCL